MDSKKFPKFIPSLSFSPTARGGRGEVVRGLEAGADDYIRKPYDLGAEDC
jgi:CheY-like chemotaxis protein